METMKILFFRDLFFKAFIVGVLFAVFFGVVTIALWNTLLPWVVGIFGVDQNIASPDGKKFYFQLANELISKGAPGVHNQAVMEFGALHCLPQNPKCTECIFNRTCFAFQHDQQANLPVKIRQQKIRTRHFFAEKYGWNAHVLLELKSTRSSNSNTTAPTQPQAPCCSNPFTPTPPPNWRRSRGGGGSRWWSAPPAQLSHPLRFLYF